MKTLFLFLSILFFSFSTFAADCQVKHHILSNGSDRAHVDFLIEDMVTFKGYSVMMGYHVRLTQTKIEIYEVLPSGDRDMIVATTGNQIEVVSDIKLQNEKVIFSVKCSR